MQEQKVAALLLLDLDIHKSLAIPKNSENRVPAPNLATRARVRRIG